MSNVSAARFAILAAVVVLIAGAPVFANTWDVSSNWSSANNPGGTWSYGWNNSTTPFTLYVRDQWPTSGTTRWCGGTLAVPDRNNYGTVSKDNSTGTVSLTDAPTGNTIVRWTSPISGTVHVMARLSGFVVLQPYAPFPYCFFSVYQNATLAYTTNVRSYLGVYPYTTDMTVSVGDTIDFRLAMDQSNGVVTQHTALLSAVITNDPVGTLTGSVTANSSGHPAIAAAEVKTLDGKYLAKTGPDGTFVLTMPAGNYGLAVSAQGLISQQASNVTVPGNGSVTRNFDLSGATVSGVVTSNDSGNPTINGAIVRTDGEPSYTATTGTDGHYTISAPAGTYSLLATAAGHDTQKMAVTLTAGVTTPVNFALRTSGLGTLVSLPSATDWGEPPMAPTAPGDSFPIAFANPGALPDPSAPRISGWNETVKPDESFTMTGARFTARTGADAGTDTIVWVWARTSSSGGVLKQAKLWKVTENTIVALLPDNIPFGMYLIWVENENGASAPIAMNRAMPLWVGPLGNTVAAGSTKRIFGRNISYNHGTSVSNVYIQPSAGGSLIQCAVTKTDPFSVEFTVPAGTPNGSYKAYVHNGWGGRYGWAEGIDIVVQDPWVRGTTETALSPSGGDDAPAIQTAINSLNALPNGGTVKLSAGTFTTYAGLSLKSKVRVSGAGMNLTTIQLRENVSTHDYIHVEGDHMGIDNLTLNACLDTPVIPGYGIIGGPYPNVTDANDIKYLNMRITGDYGTLVMNIGMGYSQVEIGGCELYRGLGPGSIDGWLHDTNVYGGPYGVYAPVYVGETEAGAYLNSQTVMENCHVETQNWPVNPTDGSRNYLNFMDPSYKVWAKRVALMGGAYHYCANITTKDVAVQDNRGEMFLFHGAAGCWFGNVLANNGLTMTVRTDGLVDGQAITISNYGVALAGGQTTNDAWPWYSPNIGKWMVIVAGKGIGQTRRLVTYTENTFTVDKPWTVQPDSTSKVILSPLYLGSTIYNNDLNAFPIGYVQDYDASRGTDIDGNGWQITVEGNTSRRTYVARDMHSNSGGPTYWCEMRDEKAYDCHAAGYMIYYWDATPIGPTLLGNAFRSCQANIVDSSLGATNGADGEGSIFENLTLTSKLGYVLSGVAGPPSYGNTTPWPDGFTLFRNGSVTVFDGPASPATPEPVYVSATDGKQLLVNNTYSGSSQTYFLANGLSGYSIPVSMYRVARFTGNVGYPLQPAILPIVNAGIASMNWTAASSDSWITPSIQSNSTLAAESTLGRLVVSVDTTGLSAGRHWGSVTVNTGTGSVKVGVCVDLTAGPPATQSPVASFTATPPAGPASLAVSFDAGASVDTDGSIQSYVWDFGDGSYASGVTASHTYPNPNTYTPVLTVTDNLGATGSSWTNITVSPVLTGVSIAGTPVGSIDINTPVSLTANAAGGYLVQYRFMLKDGTGWHIIRDYASGNSLTWTPSVAGYYELKVCAKNTGSTSVYDVASGILSYPVGLLPTGAKLWLKADAGISSSGGLVSSWTDQSGSNNNVTQPTGINKPTVVDNAMNGRPVVRFTGPGQLMQSLYQVLNGPTSFTAFTIARFNQIPAGTYQYLWWNGPDSIAGGYGCLLSNGGNIRAGWGSYNAATTDPSLALAGSVYRICSVFTSTNGTGPNQLFMNGNLVATRTKGSSPSNLSGGVFSIGNFGPSPGSGLYGDIAEMLIYDRNLSDTERGSVDQYLQARWLPPTSVSKDRLKDVKTLGDGVLVSITSAKVAVAASGVYVDGSVYVIEPDRTAGLKITGAGTVNMGDNLTLTGTTDTDVATGERVLRVTSVVTGANTPLGALGMTNQACSASGQYVRVWGKVTAKTSAYLTLDDGSGSPVKVETDGLAVPLASTPNVGDYISATGPAGCMAGGIPAVRVTSGSDIQAY